MSKSASLVGLNIVLVPKKESNQGWLGSETQGLRTDRGCSINCRKGALGLAHTGEWALGRPALSGCWLKPRQAMHSLYLNVRGTQHQGSLT